MGHKTRFEEHWITTPEGRRLYAHLHVPDVGGAFPGIVIVPGGMGTGTDFDNIEGLSADEVASLGFAVLHFDPSGRGRTGGEENYWGTTHQSELYHAVKHLAGLPAVGGRAIGILSFSIGVTMAAGALARFSLPEVAFLFDMEGPSNRYNITMNDTLELFAGFPTSDNEFWGEREAARYMGDIKCSYFRYQAEEDHVQGIYKGHAVELLNLATRGRAAWTRCNDNPENTVFDEGRPDDYRWVPEEQNDKGQILKYLLEVADKCIRS